MVIAFNLFAIRYPIYDRSLSTEAGKAHLPNNAQYLVSLLIAVVYVFLVLGAKPYQKSQARTCSRRIARYQLSEGS